MENTKPTWARNFNTLEYKKCETRAMGVELKREFLMLMRCCGDVSQTAKQNESKAD